MISDVGQFGEPVKSSVLIVDDHPLVRLGLVDLINAEADLAVCCEAASSLAALRMMRMCPPNAAIVDISLPGINGIELIKIMKAELPKLPILVLSMYDEERYALRALRAGALGYLTKSEASGGVLQAVRKILKGGFMSVRSSVNRCFASRFRRAKKAMTHWIGDFRRENWKSSSCLDADWE